MVAQIIQESLDNLAKRPELVELASEAALQIYGDNVDTLESCVNIAAENRFLTHYERNGILKKLRDRGYGRREAIHSINKEREYTQKDLNWICLESSRNIDLIPDWVWLAACDSVEKKYFLPSGFLSVKNFPRMNHRNETITVNQLLEKLAE